MTTQIVSWKSADNTLHETEELAVRHDLENILVAHTTDPEDLGSLSKLLWDCRQLVVDALQVKTNPKLKLRKPRKDKGQPKKTPAPDHPPGSMKEG